MNYLLRLILNTWIAFFILICMLFVVWFIASFINWDISCVWTIVDVLTPDVLRMLVLISLFIVFLFNIDPIDDWYDPR